MYLPKSDSAEWIEEKQRDEDLYAMEGREFYREEE